MEQKMVPRSDATKYQFSPTVERGVVSWDETNGKRPFIWFISTGVEYEETFNSSTKVEIFIEMHGYVDSEGYGATENMMMLLKDLEYFLYNDYTEPVNLLSCIISEGGANEETGQAGFMLNIKVISDFDITTIL